MFEYHISCSNAVWYCFKYDLFRRPCGRFKSTDPLAVYRWILEMENFSDNQNNITFSFNL